MTQIKNVRDSLKQFEQIFSGYDVRDAMEIKGEDGYTPVKGEDYMTPQDIEEMTVSATPVVGEDYFTEEQIDRIVDRIVERVKNEINHAT